MTEPRHDGLEGVRILANLTADARRELGARCAWCDFRRGQLITQQQENRRTVFFLTAGKAWAMFFSQTGKQVTARDIDAGEMFGDLVALDGRSQAAVVEAVTKCTVARMPLETFWDMLCAEPAVMAEVLKRVAWELGEVYQRVVELSTLSVRGRVRAELLRMAERNGTAAGDAVLYPAPTNADIAARIAALHVSVNRELEEMVAAGLIERRGRTLVIPDVEKLRRLVAEPD